MTLRLSATQIRMWNEQCNMLWFISYVQGKKSPQTKAQSDGQKIHQHLESYLKDGVYPDLSDPFGLIASRALHLLPMERLPQSEVSFDDLPVKPTCEFRFAGFIDLLCLEGKMPLILDFKTTKSRRWVKPAYMLKSDIQLMIYAKYALANAPSADRVEIGLLYLGKDPAKPFVQEVKDVVTRAEVDLFWEAIVMKTAREIELAMVSSPNEISRNYDFCSAYGGCKATVDCESNGVSF